MAPNTSNSLHATQLRPTPLDLPVAIPQRLTFYFWVNCGMAVWGTSVLRTMVKEIGWWPFFSYTIWHWTLLTVSYCGSRTASLSRPQQSFRPCCLGCTLFSVAVVILNFIDSNRHTQQPLPSLRLLRGPSRAPSVWWPNRSGFRLLLATRSRGLCGILFWLQSSTSLECTVPRIEQNL